MTAAAEHAIAYIFQNIAHYQPTFRKCNNTKVFFSFSSLIRHLYFEL